MSIQWQLPNSWKTSCGASSSFTVMWDGVIQSVWPNWKFDWRNSYRTVPYKAKVLKNLFYVQMDR
jgi:hypothetical protein